MYVKKNRGNCLLRLQRYLISKNKVTESGLVSRDAASHRVNLIVLHCIGEKVLPTKDAPIIFADFSVVSGNHG